MDDPERLGELLLTVPPLHERLLQLGDLGPAPGSNALTDLEVGQPAELVLGELVRSGALTSVGNAIDHLVSWAGLCVRGKLLPTFAHFTLLRSTVEAASTARWLVDPTVDRRVRVARGIGHQLADLGERNKLERIARPSAAPVLPPSPPDARTADQRIKALDEAAAAAGLCPLRIGHTDVVARYGLGEFAYRMLCAFAHGGQAIPFAASSRGEPADPDVGGLRSVRLTGDVAGAIQMTDAAIALAHLTLVEVFAYHGHAFALPPPGGL